MSPNPKRSILLIDSTHPVFSELLTAHAFQIVDGTAWSRSEILEKLNLFYGVSVRSRIIIDKEFIDCATNLRFIARAGAGMESINVEYANENGISCLNSPEGNRDAVAEQAMGMLLSLLNNIPQADQEVRQGKWNREKNRGTELRGKTIGIVGYGNTGQEFAKRLSSFGVRILVYDKYRSNFAQPHIVESTMEDVFLNADIVSFHVPLSTETTNLCNAAFLNKFKKHVIVLNTSRGPVVNTGDLVECMKSGKVLGVCLDVLEYEESSFEDVRFFQNEKDIPAPLKYLMASENTILTPHIAGWTHESKINLAKILVEKILKLQD